MVFAPVAPPACSEKSTARLCRHNVDQKNLLLLAAEAGHSFSLCMIEDVFTPVFLPLDSSKPVYILELIRRLELEGVLTSAEEGADGRRRWQICSSQLQLRFPQLAAAAGGPLEERRSSTTDSVCSSCTPRGSGCQDSDAEPSSSSTSASPSKGPLQDLSSEHEAAAVKVQRAWGNFKQAQVSRQIVLKAAAVKVQRAWRDFKELQVRSQVVKEATVVLVQRYFRGSRIRRLVRLEKEKAPFEAQRGEKAAVVLTPPPPPSEAALTGYEITRGKAHLAHGVLKGMRYTPCKVAEPKVAQAPAKPLHGCCSPLQTLRALVSCFTSRRQGMRQRKA